MISIIVAHDKNRLIGANNMLPWYLPGDLKYFKQQTLGKTVIMGRKTFESIGKALKDRQNIVITRNASYQAENVELVSNLTEAFERANSEEIMVIGGSQIYKESLQYADRLYITQIDNVFEGDSYFPSYEGWRLVSESEPIAAGGFTFTYCIYER